MATQVRKSRVIAALTTLAVSSTFVASAMAEKPSPEAVLAKLQPVQKDVQIDRPNAAEVAKCTIELTDGDKTWIIKDVNGQIIRRFTDSNGDRKVDQWCYYKDGLEVYRDIDTDFNEAPDQFRWFNTAGIRWGEDTNGDKQIDVWRAISPEEVSAEVVAAIRDQDKARFERLLLTPKELKSLGIGKAKGEQLAKKISAAAGGFAPMAGGQKQISSETKWVSFGGTQPGLVPAGPDFANDLTVYENVAAMVETAGKPLPVMLGTMIRVKDAWRLIDVPIISDDNTADASSRFFFFASNDGNRPETSLAGRPNDEMQKLLEELRKLEAAGQGNYDKKAELLEKIAKVSDNKEQRSQWYHQLADSIWAAVQAGEYPDGVEKLKEFQEKLKADPQDDELVCYFQMRQMFAEHNKQLNLPGQSENFQKIQTQWIDDLENFVKAARQYPDSAEAILELAISQEFNGDEKKALEWYATIEKDYPKAAAHKKASGAKLRLQSIGNGIPLYGKTIDNKEFSLAKEKNKVVLIQYWATWCEPCIADMPLLEKLRNKYGKSGFEVVGVCLDMQKQDMIKFLKENDPGWPQLFAEGGLENQYAIEMGIMTLPTMILVDKQGKVVNRNIRANELDTELKALLK